MSTAQSGRAASSPPAKLKELEAQVKTCQLCRLAKTRTNAVPGEGDIRAEVMLVGEGPGYHEDKQGRPFVGAAGHFLNELLQIAGLERESVFIANVVKCRPPNNRDPNPDEIAACAPYLERQIELINPRVIVTLGRFSMSRFFPGERISQIHGTARKVDGRMCVAMYHPAAGLHQASLADVIRSDFRKLPIFIEQARRSVSANGVAEQEERVAEAQAAREEVVHVPATAAPLPGDLPEQTGVEVTASRQSAVPAFAVAEAGPPEQQNVEPQEQPPAEPQPAARQSASPVAETAARRKRRAEAQVPPAAENTTVTAAGEAAIRGDGSDAGDRNTARPDKKKKGGDYEQLPLF